MRISGRDADRPRHGATGSRRLGAAALVVAVLATGMLLVAAAGSPTAVAEANGPSQPGPTTQAVSATDSSQTFISGVSLPMLFTTFECTFTVPELPQTYHEQSVFVWCGVQQADASDPALAFGVLRPVLMYGPDCTSSTIGLGPGADPHYGDSNAGDPAYWYFSAQYVYPDGAGTHLTCSTGPGFKAYPGDVLVSTMAYDTTADTMTVSMSDGANTSAFVAANPWLDTTKSWSSEVGQTVLR